MKSVVFVVEDSATMRTLVRSALEQDGHEVSESSDGRAALQVLEDLTPDLIIADITMPEMDGLSLVRHLRRSDALRATPVLILTTETDAALKVEAREAGATGWITKPFHPDQLRDVVTRVLERSRRHG